MPKGLSFISYFTSADEAALVEILTLVKRIGKLLLKGLCLFIGDFWVNLFLSTTSLYSFGIIITRNRKVFAPILEKLPSRVLRKAVITLSIPTKAVIPIAIISTVSTVRSS